MYTIDDLRGKYVKVGTPEAEVFLRACGNFGARYASDESITYPFIELFSGVKGELIIYGLRNKPASGEEPTPFTTKPQWSIYTNDKPLCELSDEQAGMLFNAWRGDGEVECKGLNGEFRSAYELWCIGAIYRIKPKSERELFIEAAMQLMTSETERTLEQQFGALFDSGNFKLVKDGE